MDMQRLITTAPGDAWGPLPPHATDRGSHTVRAAPGSVLFGDEPSGFRSGAASAPRKFLRGLEALLLLSAVLFLGYYGYVQAETFLYQRYEERELTAILNSRSAAIAPTMPVAAPQARPATGAAIGRIEIPRLGVSAIVRAGSDARTLRLAVGHIPGTALPGEAGNVGLAGHRDTFFRRLRDVKSDDEIRVTTPAGTFSYWVERTDIVNPRDVWVLDPTREPALTLVTCYPFNFVGAAPQRFIVRAALRAPNVEAHRQAPSVQQ